MPQGYEALYMHVPDGPMKKTRGAENQTLVVLSQLPKGSSHRAAARLHYFPLSCSATAQYKGDSQPFAFKVHFNHFVWFRDLFLVHITHDTSTNILSSFIWHLHKSTCHLQPWHLLLYENHNESWLAAHRNHPPSQIEHTFLIVV